LDRCGARLIHIFIPLLLVSDRLGCPSIEAGGASKYGASLMKQSLLTRDLLSTIREAANPSTSVSLKCRVGVCDSPGEQGWSYEDLHSYLSTAAEGGVVDRVVLHARYVHLLRSLLFLHSYDVSFSILLPGLPFCQALAPRKIDKYHLWITRLLSELQRIFLLCA
jgi:hypothetical protein